MAFAFKFTLDSARMHETLARLDGLKMGRRNVILRTACTKACRILAKAAGAKLRDRRREQKKQGITRNGLLKKSMGYVVRVYGNKVVGVIGPRNGFKTQIGVRTRGGAQRTVEIVRRKYTKTVTVQTKKGDPIFEDPAKIGHLVEFGHGGPHPAPAYPFMRPAWDENAARIEQLFAEEVSVGLRKLVERGKFTGTRY